MKKFQLPVILILISGFLFTTSLFSQEKTKVSIKVEKDGKVVHDTTYTYDDAKSAKHVIKMAEAMSKGEMEAMLHPEHAHMSKDVHVEMKDGHKVKTMVYIDEDGKKEVKEIHGDSLIWITEKHHDGEHVKVIKKKIKVTGEDGEKKVYVITSGDEDEEYKFDIMEENDNVKVMKISEGEGGVITIIESDEGDEKRVEVKVITDEDGEGTWTVESDGDEEVIVIKKKKGEKEVKEGDDPPAKQKKKTKKQK